MTSPAGLRDLVIPWTATAWCFKSCGSIAISDPGSFSESNLTLHRYMNVAQSLWCLRLPYRGGHRSGTRA